MTRSEALDLMSDLASAFPRQVLTKETIALFCAHLLQFKYERGLEVVRRYIASQKWFPALSELLGELDGNPNAIDAWALVMVELRRVGHTGVPQLPKFVVKVVADFGGWGRLCKMENTVAERSRFIELYDRKFRAQLGEQYALTAGEASPLALTDGAS